MMNVLTSDITRSSLAIPVQTPALRGSIWMYEDKEFKHNNCIVYQKIARQLKEKRIFREYRIDNLSQKISTVLSGAGFDARVYGRPKHIYSIHKKMCRQCLPFDGIQDLNGLRIVLERVEDCYLVLHQIHKLWSPVPGNFDDYIAAPKKSGYQSLHTTVQSSLNTKLEIQIRTVDMHYEAEYGKASHWRYKLRFA